MSEDLLENIAEGEVYTVRTIVISTVFGGLLGGSYMIYQNFKKFGEPKKAIATLIISIFTLLGIIATAFSPQLEKIPGLVYTVVIGVAVSILTKKYQGELIEKHIAANGKIYSSGRAVVISIISILLILAFAMGIFLLQDAIVSNR